MLWVQHLIETGMFFICQQNLLKFNYRSVRKVVAKLKEILATNRNEVASKLGHYFSDPFKKDLFQKMAHFKKGLFQKLAYFKNGLFQKMAYFKNSWANF